MAPGFFLSVHWLIVYTSWVSYCSGEFYILNNSERVVLYMLCLFFNLWVWGFARVVRFDNLSYPNGPFSWSSGCNIRIK